MNGWCPSRFKIWNLEYWNIAFLIRSYSHYFLLFFCFCQLTDICNDAMVSCRLDKTRFHLINLKRDVSIFISTHISQIESSVISAISSSPFVYHVCYILFYLIICTTGILRPHIHLIVPVICKLISQLQDIGTQTVPWQCKAVASLRRICTSARGAVVEQSLIVVSRTVHCLTRTITIALDGTYVLL